MVCGSGIGDCLSSPYSQKIEKITNKSKVAKFV